MERRLILGRSYSCQDSSILGENYLNTDADLRRDPVLMIEQKLREHSIRKKLEGNVIVGQQINGNSSNSSVRYKTELCRPYEENGFCKYGEKCQFAHGKEELRCLIRHPKYKTEFCRTFHTAGFCPYGRRCHFIHNEDERTLNRLNQLLILEQQINSQRIEQLEKEVLATVISVRQMSSSPEYDPQSPGTGSLVMTSSMLPREMRVVSESQPIPRRAHFSSASDSVPSFTDSSASSSPVSMLNDEFNFLSITGPLDFAAQSN